MGRKKLFLRLRSAFAGFGDLSLARDLLRLTGVVLVPKLPFDQGLGNAVGLAVDLVIVEAVVIVAASAFGLLDIESVVVLVGVRGCAFAGVLIGGGDSLGLKLHIRGFDVRAGRRVSHSQSFAGCWLVFGEVVETA